MVPPEDMAKTLLLIAACSYVAGSSSWLRPFGWEFPSFCTWITGLKLSEPCKALQNHAKSRPVQRGLADLRAATLLTGTMSLGGRA